MEFKLPSNTSVMLISRDTAIKAFAQATGTRQASAMKSYDYSFSLKSTNSLGIEVSSAIPSISLPTFAMWVAAFFRQPI